MIHVGVVGGTGYTGVELLRILSQHPDVAIKFVTSRSEKDIRVSQLFPSLRGLVDTHFCEPDVEKLSQCEIVFFATPSGTAMRMIPSLLENAVKVIDLSADFRIKDPAIWEHWYGEPHCCPKLLEEAVYGLVEINRPWIRNARLVACPGCYPTAVQLGFFPLLEAGLVDLDRLIADVKSGVSGAGRKAQIASLMSEAGEGLKAYTASGHRHLPEISQQLAKIAENPVELTFVPHLVPMIRGIHATLYASLSEFNKNIQNLYEHRYAHESFVDVLPPGSHPDTADVRGSNRCQIAIHRPMSGNIVVILSTIDNLVKGAAGQAVQNMNLMLGLDESRGLSAAGLYP